MITIFATLTIDPAQRAEVDAAFAKWIADNEKVRTGALIYKYLVDPTEPDKSYLLQCWESDEVFQTWVASEGHQSGGIIHQQFIKGGGAVVLEGCTGIAPLTA
jgi:quinol monooxygenase YgiN